MNFASKSQAGQDEWVYSLFAPDYKGTFLDIGSGHPIEISNTYALEQAGWRGFCIDQGDVAHLYNQLREHSTFIQADATKLDYIALLFGNERRSKTFDYLSLDVDEASLATLKHLPFNRLHFRCATIEHDRYRFGQQVADEMRSIMTSYGYTSYKLDITHDNLPYEDWWVNPKLL